jgi:hypothetical protein
LGKTLRMGERGVRLGSGGWPPGWSEMAGWVV